MNYTDTITVGRLWHKKGKNEYFSMKQLIETFPNINFEFHLILDDYEYSDEWSKKIDELNTQKVFYSKKFMDDYFIKCYPMMIELVESFPKFIHFYHILIGHYLRRVLLKDYMLMYEFDVIFNGDVPELEEVIKNKIPFGIIEPLNMDCDKALLDKLSAIYNTNLLDFTTKNNPTHLGINAGFMGVGLVLFDNFLSTLNLSSLLNIFDFQGIYKEDGTERWGSERTAFDTQEQSFYSIMNQVCNGNFTILPKDKYFFWPCWEDFEGYIDTAMNSKVIHFTGHKKAGKLYEIINNSL